MRLDTDGAERHEQALSPADLAALRALHDSALRGRAGARGRLPGSERHLGAADAIARAVLGRGARPVRSMLFDKTAATNWSLGWHQDCTIAVRERADVPGFGAWTRKHGIDHAVPPLPLLERMLTLRIHLDPVDEDNAPLLVAPGSHRLGLIAEPDIAGALERCGRRTCPAAAGDIWACAALILHASDRSRSPARRRVIQISYSADDLPAPLLWLGI